MAIFLGGRAFPPGTDMSRLMRPGTRGPLMGVGDFAGVATLFPAVGCGTAREMYAFTNVPKEIQDLRYKPDAARAAGAGTFEDRWTVRFDNGATHVFTLYDRTAGGFNYIVGPVHNTDGKVVGALLLRTLLQGVGGFFAGYYVSKSGTKYDRVVSLTPAGGGFSVTWNKFSKTCPDGLVSSLNATGTRGATFVAAGGGAPKVTDDCPRCKGCADVTKLGLQDALWCGQHINKCVECAVDSAIGGGAGGGGGGAGGPGLPPPWPPVSPPPPSPPLPGGSDTSSTAGGWSTGTWVGIAAVGVAAVVGVVALTRKRRAPALSAYYF